MSAFTKRGAIGRCHYGPAFAYDRIFFFLSLNSDTLANSAGDRVENDSNNSETDVKNSNSPLYLDNNASSEVVVSEPWSPVSNIHTERTYIMDFFV